MALLSASAVIVAFLLLLIASIKQVNQYERGVKFRFGKYVGMMQPGWRIIIPIIERWVRIDIRIRTLDVEPQDCVSKDNISIKVNAVVYYHVQSADKAVLEVEDFAYAVSQLSQTTMRNIVGEFELDDILQRREKISKEIQGIVDKATDPWGIKVEKIELKDITLPDNMKRAMAAQAEAERDRRARITLAIGEEQAASKLAEAAKKISAQPAALQLRLFQTMSEIASERNSTIILPVPVELLEYLKKLGKEK